MKVALETVDRIAHLARLEFNDQDKAAMAEDLTAVLSWMEKLNEVDTSNVEPLIHISTEVNVFRDDVAKETLSHNEALSNAPKKDSDYFRVPKWIE